MEYFLVPSPLNKKVTLCHFFYSPAISLALFNELEKDKFTQLKKNKKGMILFSLILIKIVSSFKVTAKNIYNLSCA